MVNPFADLETNLGRAGWIMLLAVFGSIATGMVLEALSINSSFAMLFSLALFPFAAWFMARAASLQGRNPAVYGLASLLPPFAILVFIILYNRDVEMRLAEKRLGDA